MRLLISKGRSKFTSELKTCIAPEAISGNHSIAELSAKWSEGVDLPYIIFTL